MWPSGVTPVVDQVVSSRIRRARIEPSGAFRVPFLSADRVMTWAEPFRGGVAAPRHPVPLTACSVARTQRWLSGVARRCVAPTLCGSAATKWGGADSRSGERPGGPKLAAAARAMRCRACQETEIRGRARGERRPKRRHSGAHGQLCSRCGNLLGPADLVQRVQDKQSQLARFGLMETDGTLLEPRPRKDH
jgi:hypothetical protein